MEPTNNDERGSYTPLIHDNDLAQSHSAAPLDVNRMYHRQEELIKPDDLVFPITVVGAGGIGSWAAFSLAKMGCKNLTIIDPDIIEVHNLPSQMYGVGNIGEGKAYALAGIINAFTNTHVQGIGQTFEDYFESEGFTIPDVIIIAVDSIAARREIWTIMKPLLDMTQLYLDVRMGGETLRMMAISPLAPESIESYEKKLFGTAKPHKESCTSRAIVYNTQMAGALIASTVKKFAKKEEVRRDFFFDITDAGAF